MEKQKVELLAPAGDLEKLKFAIIYGADAVYIGGEFFGLRSAAKNFTKEEMREGIAFAHDRGKKVYLTLNIVPHEGDIEMLPEYLEGIRDLDLDAVIVADPGTMAEVKRILPEMEIHLSTQANTTNAASCKFWHDFGVKRVVLARELSFDEVKSIRNATPDTLGIEIFIHGAMCISHSGRCLLSNYLTGRDSNRGDCAQPCRWSYNLVESSRPGEYFPIEQDEQGTYIMNSKDLCMIDRIPELMETGAESLKIEGRMKTCYYVASVCRVYREAIDHYYRDPENYQYQPEWLEELQKTSYREFTRGFYDGKPGKEAQLYTSAAYVRDYDFVGVVLEYDEEKKIALIEQRNNFGVGREVEVMGPGYYSASFVVDELFDEAMQPIDVARHAKMKVWVKSDLPLKPYYILRAPRQS